MSFTDQKPRVATEEECKFHWNGGKNGKYFRCHLCGKKFEPGDIYRFVFTNNVKGAGGNPLICETCDGPDIIERWKKHREEFDVLKDRFWWFFKQFAIECEYKTMNRRY